MAYQSTVSHLVMNCLRSYQLLKIISQNINHIPAKVRIPFFLLQFASNNREMTSLKKF